MATHTRKDLPDRLMPSILDRLLGLDAEYDGYSLDEMFTSVRRDLEDLLNTHAPPTELAEGYVFLRRSVAAFGLPDLASLLLRSQSEGIAVSTLLEDVLGRFEPRLTDVRISEVPDKDAEKQFRMRFQIEAKLAIDPYPQVAFETVLELATGRTFVSAGT